MTPLPTILQMCCEVCNVSEADARSTLKRTQSVVDCKHAFAHIATVRGSEKSYLAQFLGLTVNTVHYRIQAAFDRVETDPKFRDICQRILERVHCAGDHVLNASQWVCDCGTKADPMSPDWKWDGRNWLHMHTAMRKEK